MQSHTDNELTKLNDCHITTISRAGLQCRYCLCVGVCVCVCSMLASVWVSLHSNIVYEHSTLHQLWTVCEQRMLFAPLYAKMGCERWGWSGNVVRRRLLSEVLCCSHLHTPPHTHSDTYRHRHAHVRNTSFQMSMGCASFGGQLAWHRKCMRARASIICATLKPAR